MRSIRRIAGFIALAALVAGCDTTQPLQVDQETFELRVQATGASIPALSVYDTFQDNDMNGIPDPAFDWNNDGVVDPFEDQTVWTFCRSRTSAPLTASVDSVPVRYHAQIQILRAGETVPTTITSDSALNAVGTLTSYNSLTTSTGSISLLNPVVIMDNFNGVSRRFVFTNPRIGSRADRYINRAVRNPLSFYQPNTYPLGAGLCSSTDLGETQMDGMIGNFPIILNKGDTVTVNLRRADTVPVSLGLLNNPPGPGLRGQLLRNGLPVAVRGDTQSPTSGPGQGLSFTYTTR